MKFIPILALILLSFTLQETKEEFIQPKLIKHYIGQIDRKFVIEMNLTPNGSGVLGRYRYTSHIGWYVVAGSIDPATGTVHLEESISGKVTGTFDGIQKNNVITGTQANADKTYNSPFTLTTDHRDINVKFKVTYKIENGYVSSQAISVWSFDGKTFMQQLEMGSALEIAGAPGDRPELNFEDMNFDGYPDLSTVAGGGNAKTTYYYWLYHPTTRKFVLNAQLSGMTNQTVDPVNKQIKTFYLNHSTSITFIDYEFKNGRYVEVSKTTKEYY